MVEIDITHSSLDRLGINAAFGVPEVWRYDGADLHVYRLADGQMVEGEASGVFPFLPLSEVRRFIALRAQLSETDVVRQWRSWVQSINWRSPAKT